MVEITPKKDIIVGTIAIGIFAVAGICLLYFGSMMLRERLAFIETAQQGIGRVIRIERVQRVGGSLLKNYSYPVVQIDSQGGDRRTVKIAVNWIGGPKTGDKVNVVYSQTDEGTAYLDSFLGLWADLTLVFVLGLGVLLIPPFTIWRHFKTK